MEETPGCIAAVEEAVKPAVVAAAGLAGYAGATRRAVLYGRCVSDGRGCNTGEGGGL
ncbi:MAG: hypothetical protein QW434_00740 [Pyrobaculum sp.]